MQDFVHQQYDSLVRWVPGALGSVGTTGSFHADSADRGSRFWVSGISLFWVSVAFGFSGFFGLGFQVFFRI